MEKSKPISGEMEDQKALRTANLVNQSCLLNLPTAVLHEILFKLPVSSIMQMKLVCRSLYKLVSNPDFSMNYSKMSPFYPVLLVNYQRSYLIYPIMRLILLELYDNVEEYIQTPLKPKIPNELISYSCLSLAHTSDGLLCLSQVEPQVEIAYICNPITGECITLPEHRMNRKEGYIVEYGFGFCRSTNSYKVLRIVSKSDWITSECEILTIGVDDKWRVLPYPVFPSPVNNTEFFNLNGVLHWFLMENGSACIHTFDLGEEILGQIPTPHGLAMNFDNFRLIKFNDHLCIVDYSHPSGIAIWKMKEYAVGDSWTIDIVIERPFPLQLGRLIPVTVLRNGDILFCHSRYRLADNIISYNPIKRVFKEIPVRCRGGGSHVYTPSFLSLNEFVMGHNGVP